MGLPIFDKAVGRLTHIPRQLNILPERAKTIDGVSSIITGKKEKKKSILTEQKKSMGSTLT